MKILHTVQMYLPSLGGMQEVVRQLSERLVSRGHEVTVATSYAPERNAKMINGVRIREFNVSGNLVAGMQGEVAAYQKFLLASDFDIITNFAAQQWATDAMLVVLDQIPARKVFVPTGFTALPSFRYRHYFELMKKWMRHYDMTVFLSDDYRDINFARDNRIENYRVIPNGADEKDFLRQSPINIRGKLNIPYDDFLVLHVGSHTGIKGHREAIEIFSRAAIENATFLLVGNHSGGCHDACSGHASRLNASAQFRAANKKIIVTSLKREETISAFQAADLFLFPSNIECSPVVLFEAAASKTPFLTADVGNAAEIVEWTKGGILLPTYKNTFTETMLNRFVMTLGRLVGHVTFDKCIPFDSIGMVKVDVPNSTFDLEKLYRHKERRHLMADAGFASWKERFTWSKIASQYEQLYQTICDTASKEPVY